MPNRILLTLIFLLVPVYLFAASTQRPGPWLDSTAKPTQRFINNNNGTITDNLSGLIWLKDANCTETLGGVTKKNAKSWLDARIWTKNLASGSCGLTDGSATGDWRLPDIEELKSLINPLQAKSDAWLIGQGFVNVESYWYWSASTDTTNSEYAWRVGTDGGGENTKGKKYDSYAWPVRGK